MLDRSNRSLPWMVAVVIAVAIVGLVGVSAATTEQDESFVRTPQTCHEADDPVEWLRLATAGLSQPLTVTFANEKGAPEGVRPTATEASGGPGGPGAIRAPDDSFPGAPQAATASGMKDCTEGLTLATVGRLEAVPAGVTDEEIPQEAEELAFVDLASGAPQRTELTLEAGEEEIEEYDPWEPFNEATFSFNRKLDQLVIKPVAKAWDKILPDRVKQSLENAIDNLAMPRRFVNKLFQLRFKGAGLELTRFLLNTTVGIAGFFDVAKAVGIEKKDADTGQTFAVYGAGPGPYLVLPFLPPLTVRDGVGFAVDSALDPFNYVIFPFAALTAIPLGKRLNDRAFNLELFETVEETTVDLYTAVRNAYLQRRHKLIRE